jgi:hypothetical protein
MVVTKSERYREILATLARHGIGVVDDEFIKHEAGDRARAEHLRSACEELLRSRIGQRGLAAIVRRLPEGPNQAERIGHHSTVWTEAMDALGRSLSTPDPYDFTANSSLEIASRITALPVPLGLVPSRAFGPDFVLSLPGRSRTDIPARALTRE